MKINNLILNEIKKSDNKVNLKPGTIIKGKVSEIIGDTVLLELNNGELIKGKSLISLESSKNQVVSFLIKEIKDTKITMTPLFQDSDKKSPREMFVDKILEINNIPKNKESIEAIKYLTKFNMPVNKETIESVLKTLFKLQNIAELKGNEVITSLNNNYYLKENIDELLINSKIINDDNKILPDNNNNEVKIDKHYKDMEKLKNEVKNILFKNQENHNLIKKIVFLKKLGLKSSVLNLKFLDELVEGKGFIE
ncbi:hypothetical protein, partial [Caldisalinibacter kiritimatiensis]|uniref:hypothetical protein n=1 Tax=Caldisalinibacter kiritimatiensis TaxID=1304284 RepID=UPI00055057D4